MCSDEDLRGAILGEPMEILLETLGICAGGEVDLGIMD